MSKAFLYLRKSYILISRFSSLLPWIILRSSVMSALRYSSNSLKSSSSSSNGHRELSTGLFKSEQFNQEGLTPGSRAQRSIYCSPGRAIWRDHSERMDEAAVRLHQHFRRNRDDTNDNWYGDLDQRLAVARAVCSDSPVLLLDVCTSALDPKTEREMLDRMRNLGHTVIIVTHRSAALEVCDRVIGLASKW